MEFDEDLVAALERLYRTPPMRARRARVREALALDAGDAVLSVGCGPGFETLELASVVGEHGRVVGVDAAAQMLAAARERCADQSWVSFEAGDATALPVDDGAFDAATAVQVYEYVSDLDTAFEELFRVLRPGGRAVVFDSDWSTLAYHAADEARSARVVDAYDAHCPHPRLARTLKPRLQRAGFEVTDQDVFSHFETVFEGSVGEALLAPIRRVVTEEGGIDDATADAWVEDVRERAAAGEFFFTFNQYLFVAERP